MDLFIAILLLIISYLLGSIPSALLVGKKVKGIDIREHGSKNMGATNALRVLGKKWGIITFLMDALKAGLLVFLIKYNIFNLGEICFNPLIYGLFAIIGHLFPIFAKFKGGKGVSSAVGVMFAYSPIVTIFCAISFFSVFAKTRYVSLSSLVGAIVLCIGSIIQGFICKWNTESYIFVIVAICVALIIFIRHKTNIKRLVNHTESKIEKKEN